MKEVARSLIKGWLKSKYILLVPVAIALLVVTLLVINNSQSGATQQELQETFQIRKETIEVYQNQITKDRIHWELVADEFELEQEMNRKMAEKTGDTR